jgi:hypothetical protein
MGHVILLLFDGFQPTFRKALPPLTLSDTNMTHAQFQQIMSRLEHIEKSMVTKTDIFQAVLTIQGLTLAVIVGTVVVLGATGAFQ